MGKKKVGEDTINYRLKMARIALGMTQVQFAQKIGIKGGSLSTIELGSPVTEPNILLICSRQLAKGKTVNETWLRTGQGEMFIEHTLTDGHPHLFEDGIELPADEEELIGVYRDLFESNKKLIRQSAKMALASQENTIGELSPVEKGENRKSGLKKSG
jgi:DNA-binding XRE family transcriptional regulator